MSDPSIPLTGKQKNQVHDAIAHAPVAPDMARTGAVNPHLRVFVANFDGTQNDKDRVPDGDQATLVAHCFRGFEKNGNSAIESRYYRGVGTSTSKVLKYLESFFGIGCARNANKAHDDLVRQTAIWRKEDPYIEVHVHVTGFSRGSASALHFLNLVDKKGALSQLELNAPNKAPQFLRPGTVKTSAVLLDTVSTGQGSVLELTVPGTCAALLHVPAKTEQRTLFPLREVAAGVEKELSFAINANMQGASVTPEGMVAYQRIQTVELPGAHSDIGGSYKNGGLRKISQYLMENFQASLGLGTTPVKPSFEDVQRCMLHDSRYLRMLDSATPDPERKRRVQDAQKDEWDGTYVKRIKVTTPDGKVSHALEMGEMKTKLITNDEGKSEAVSDDPVFRQMYKPREATMMPVSRDSGMGDDAYEPVHGVNVLTRDFNDRSAVEVKADGIYVLGSRVRESADLGQLKDTWEKQSLTADGAQPFKVEFDAWRLGSMTFTRQAVDAKPLPKIAQPPDPWPRPIRDTILLLNTQPPMSAPLASIAMFRSLSCVAKSLQEQFKDVKSVTIEPKTLVEKTQDGRKLTNTFVIKVERQDGSTCSSNQSAAGKADVDVSSRMRSLRRGLLEVGEGLRVAGFHPARGSAQTFITGERKIFTLKDAPIMCALSEPGVQPMVSTTSMRVLGAFSAPVRAANESSKSFARLG